MTPPVYILNLETTTKNCSVSIAKNGVCVAIKEISDEQFVHAEFINVFIENVLHESKITFQDLNAIAVSQGPGSYTGLRIGVSTAKGLCFALEIPLIALDTMQVLAQQITQPEGSIITLLDARRMEVYYAVYNQQHQKLVSTQAMVVEPHSFDAFLTDKPVLMVGDCVSKLKSVVNREGVIFKENSYPSAQEMSTLSFEKFTQNQFENLAYFEPFYLKDFIVTKKV